MPIEHTCGCKREITLPDHFAGKLAKCPGCGASMMIPKWATVTPAKKEADKPAEATETPPSHESEPEPEPAPKPEPRPSRRQPKADGAADPFRPPRTRPGGDGSRLKWIAAVAIVAIAFLGVRGILNWLNQREFVELLRSGDEYLERGYPADAEKAFRHAADILPGDPRLTERFAAVKALRTERAEDQDGVRGPDLRVPKVEEPPGKTPEEVRAEGASPVSSLANVRFTEVGPWRFAVVSFQVKRLHIKKFPFASTTYTPKGDDRVAVVGVRFRRVRRYAEDELSAIRGHQIWETVKNGRRLYRDLMFIHDGSMALCWPSGAPGKQAAVTSACQTMECLEGLHEVTHRQNEGVVGFVRGMEVDAAFVFGWEPSARDPVLVFTPVPGGRDVGAARLRIDGERLLSVEYGAPEKLYEEHWPQGLAPSANEPVDRLERGHVRTDAGPAAQPAGEVVTPASGE